MAVPPVGEALSLPVAPRLELDCQIVPVVFVKKNRVPVDVETGSAHARYPDARFAAPLQAVEPVCAVPVIDTL